MERQRQGEANDSLASSREGEGHPLVFLHGLGASREQAQAAVAAVEGVESITIDAPAHGESAASTVPLNFGAFARAVVDLLDGFDIGTAIFGGISMGAGISLRIARDFPDRVSALVLVRPAWTNEAARPHLDIVADIGEWVTSQGVDVARKLLSSDERYQLMVECEPLAAASVANAIDGVAKTGRPEVLPAMVDSAPVDDLCELADVGQPAVVISTEHDRLHPVPIAEAVAAALPNATSLLAPPRYLEPEAHQDFLTHAINSFISAVHSREVRTTGD
ncbi:MAG: alpha/beta hydrolase [Acidimicrobiia bacterium]|nr:alpha/beta hydrolase [Acidimicrobiia bacterium]